MDFLSGCSKSNAMPSNPDVSVDQPAPQQVEIAGLGKVLDQFGLSYELFDIDLLNRTNRHNEANVTPYCFTSVWTYRFDEPFARDETTFSGKKVGDKDYEFSVNINSESGTLMWKGAVTTMFKYDGASGKWSMSSSISEDGQERAYKYCNPSAVVDTLMASMQCYLSNYPEGAERETIEKLVASISAQREGILENSGQLYAANDCENPVDPRLYSADPEVPMGF